MIGADTFNLKYNAENQLVEVKKNSVVMATFAYDGDGRQVKATVNGVTTLYIGGHYEVKGNEVSKYYFAGAARIAMRRVVIPQSMTLEYLLSDHLGSTSITTDAAGLKTSELRYKPWGEVRYSWIKPDLNTTPAYEMTKYTFTGQRSEVDSFGLMFYNARWYDGATGRFAQADSIVPNLFNSQSLDRYGYVLNNPVKYSDPSGHRVSCEVGEDCKQAQRLSRFSGARYWKALIKDEFGIAMSEESDANNLNPKAWNVENLMTIYYSLGKINAALNSALRSLVAGATFKWGEHDPQGGTSTYHGLTYGTTITFYTLGNSDIRQQNIFHEFGHLMDNTPGMVNDFSRDEDINNPDFIDINGKLGRSAFVDPDNDMIQHPMSINGDDRINAQEEHWADIFANYVAGNINLASSSGSAMNTFVKRALAPYIAP